MPSPTPRTSCKHECTYTGSDCNTHVAHSHLHLALRSRTRTPISISHSDLSTRTPISISHSDLALALLARVEHSPRLCRLPDGSVDNQKLGRRVDWFDPEARCRHIPLSDSQAGAFGRQFLSFSFGPVEVCRPICDGLTTAKSNPQEWEVALDLVWVPDTFRKESSKGGRGGRGSGRVARSICCHLLLRALPSECFVEPPRLLWDGVGLR